MSKRYSIISAAVLIVLSSLGLWAALHPKEPAFRGKPLSFWLDRYYSTRLSGGDPEVKRLNEEAAVALRAIGTNAIPELLEMVHATDSRFTSKLLDLAHKQHLAKVSSWPAHYRNTLGTEGFEILGAGARDATPALVRIFERNSSPSSQAAASAALGTIGPAAGEAIPNLLRAATNASAGARCNALYALGRIRVPSETVIPALIRSLDDPDTGVRISGMKALGPLGAAAKAAVPRLAQLTEGGDHHVRLQACATLGKIRSAPETAVPALLACLADPDAHIRKAAAWNLGEFGLEARGAVPALKQLLEDRDPQVRAAADRALKEINSTSPGAGTEDDAASLHSFSASIPASVPSRCFSFSPEPLCSI